MKGPVGCVTGQIENEIDDFAAREDSAALLNAGYGKRTNSLRDRTHFREGELARQCG